MDEKTIIITAGDILVFSIVNIGFWLVVYLTSFKNPSLMYLPICVLFLVINLKYIFLLKPFSLNGSKFIGWLIILELVAGSIIIIRNAIIPYINKYF